MPRGKPGPHRAERGQCSKVFVFIHGELIKSLNLLTPWIFCLEAEMSSSGCFELPDKNLI